MRQLLLALMLSLGGLFYVGSPAAGQTASDIQEMAEWHLKFADIYFEALEILDRLDEADFIVEEYNDGRLTDEESRQALTGTFADILAEMDANIDEARAFPGPPAAIVELKPSLVNLLPESITVLTEFRHTLAGMEEQYHLLLSDDYTDLDAITIIQLKRLVSVLQMENQMVFNSMPGPESGISSGTYFGRCSTDMNSLMIDFINAEIAAISNLDPQPHLEAMQERLETYKANIESGRKFIKVDQAKLDFSAISNPTKNVELAEAASSAIDLFSDSFDIEELLHEQFAKMLEWSVELNGNTFDELERDAFFAEIDYLIDRRLDVHRQRLTIMQNFQ